MEYIRESLSDFSEGMSKDMKQCFGFVSLEAGVYSNVTEAMIDLEYNVAVSLFHARNSCEDQSKMKNR